MKTNPSAADVQSDVKCSIVIILCIPLLFVSAASEAESPFLQPGTTIAGAVDLSNGQSTQYRVSIPAHAYGVRIELSSSPADLDLILERPDGEFYVLSETERYNERLFLTKMGDPVLESGDFLLSVVYQYVDRPLVDGRRVGEIPFRLSYQVVAAKAEGELVPGVPATGILRPEEGMVRTYSVEVGRNVEELRLDVFDASGDVDLYLNYGTVAVDPLAADYLSQSYLGRESLVVTANSDPPLRSGIYFVTILDQIEDEIAGEFSIVASTEGLPAVLMEPVEPVASPDGPLDRALVSTVQVVTQTGGGSGCVVSPAGHILTSWHVVRNNAGTADVAPVVAVSVDHREPPEERFRARVLRYSIERDLALLVLESGLYGQPLPPDFEFPSFEIGDPTALYFGDELWFVGYPDVGGTGSRASITLTRGIVSGFEASAFGSIIKTDGEINEGNSGGAALNEAFELIGLPTRVVGHDAGQIAYIHPISAVPDSWWSIIHE